MHKYPLLEDIPLVEHTVGDSKSCLEMWCGMSGVECLLFETQSLHNHFGPEMYTKNFFIKKKNLRQFYKINRSPRRCLPRHFHRLFAKSFV